jgi:hypothetical protein
MVTTIKFIGLLVVMLTNPGARVIMGQFPGTGHDSFIAYSHDQYVSNSNWPAAGKFTLDGVQYDYVMVNKENVSFTGPTAPFLNGIGNMPHLQCCCPTMAGFQTAYGDPNEPEKTKKAAHFTIANGTLETYVEPTGAVSTLLTMTGPSQLKIRGTAGTTSREVVVNAGAKVIVGNSSLAAIKGAPAADHDDFLLYYKMGIDSAACTSQPTSGPPCAPRATACDVPVTAVAATQPAMATRRRAAVTPKNRRRVSQVESVTINCSTSTWP